MIISKSTETEVPEHSSRPGLPRVGQISFSNSLPVNLPIARGKVELDADVIYGEPQFLNKRIMAEQLDISSVSSFCYLSRPELDLVPGLSISSLGPVGSVLFYSRKELSDLRGKTIAIPAASATSVRIMTLLLKLEAGIDPILEVVETPDLNDDRFSGTLIIGDLALKADRALMGSDDENARIPSDSPIKYRYDLGQWWTDRFKLPMVFGVWVVRKSYREQNGSEFRRVAEKLQEARNLGMSSMLDEVINEASIVTNLPAERVRKYFVEELDYHLNDQHQESLELFRSLCKQHKLL